MIINRPECDAVYSKYFRDAKLENTFFGKKSNIEGNYSKIQAEKSKECQFAI